jgi:hypothetical protein
MDFLEDLDLYNEAMLNAYNIITKKIDLTEFLTHLEELDDNDDYLEDASFPLPFNPFIHEDISDEEIDYVIDHFADLEEYEKCAELVACKKNVK